MPGKGIELIKIHRLNMKIPCVTAILIIPKHSYHQGWNLLFVTASWDESPASATKASPWDSDTPCRQQAQSHLAPASLCQSTLPIGSPGGAWKALPSAARSVFSSGRRHQFSLRAPFSLEEYGFLSLLLLMSHYLTANKDKKWSF